MKPIIRQRFCTRLVLALGIFPLLYLLGVLALNTSKKDPILIPSKTTIPIKAPLATRIDIQNYQGGEKAFSVSIERVVVQNKRMGFLRLGFYKVARLEQVTILWYEPSSALKKGVSPGLPSESKDSLFKHLTDLRQYFPGSVKEIVMSPVAVHLFQDGNRVSWITAESARAHGEKRGVTFRGNVRVVSENGNELTCSELTWMADTGQLVITASYQATDGIRQKTGNGLETDMALTEIAF